jgi:hypothetical protein
MKKRKLKKRIRKLESLLSQVLQSQQHSDCQHGTCAICRAADYMGLPAVPSLKWI